MRLWVPPYWVRRVLHVFWLPTVVLLTAILLPFYVVGAVVAIFPGRAGCFVSSRSRWPTSGRTFGMIFGCWCFPCHAAEPGRDGLA